jgi:hypothetical protein
MLYRGYRLQIEAQALPSRKWVAHAVVAHDGLRSPQVFPMADGKDREFERREDAEAHGLALACAWIDRRASSPLTARAADTPTMPRYLVVVRRGVTDRYSALAQAFAADPEVRLLWDRRQAERRQEGGDHPLERRTVRERRAPASFTWTSLDFLITPW